MSADRTWLEALFALQSTKTPCVIITLVDIQVSAPQEQGARAIVTSQGLYQGTVGGGKVEAKAIAKAQKMLQNSQHQEELFVSWNLRADVGMTCGGIVSFYFETLFQSRWSIVIFGAGHVVQALVPLLATLECQVTIVDSREEWLNRLPPSPNQEKILEAHPAKLIPTLDPNAFYLSITQGHSTDLPIVEGLLKRQLPPYIGVIGSASKAIVLKRELMKRGVSKEALESLLCPVGLAVGGRQPAEIAISIAAQLLQVRDQRNSLRCSSPSPNLRSHTETPEQPSHR